MSEANPPWRHRGRESLLRRRWSESCNCSHCHSPRAFAEFICCDITRYIRHYQHRIGRDPREKETLVRKRKSRTPPIFSQSPLFFSPVIIRSWNHNSCVPADVRHWTLSEDDTFVCKYISQQIKNFSWISLLTWSVLAFFDIIKSGRGDCILLVKTFLQKLDNLIVDQDFQQRKVYKTYGCTDESPSPLEVMFW